jgi:hypothetical protein
MLPGTMRCTACAGEIPPGSRFCGICGRTVAGAASPADEDAPRGGDASMSLFELPVSRRGRALRIGLVLGLDAMLAGAGVWLLLAYLALREAPPPSPTPPGAAAGSSAATAAAADAGVRGRGP